MKKSDMTSSDTLKCAVSKKKKMAKKIMYGTDCKHWDNCEFRNGIDCDSEMCSEFEESEVN